MTDEQNPSGVYISSLNTDHIVKQIRQLQLHSALLLSLDKEP